MELEELGLYIFFTSAFATLLGTRDTPWEQGPGGEQIR